MKFINGLALLLVYQLVGEVAVVFLGLPVPGPVLGMLMLFLTLMIRGGAGPGLGAAANGLLSHLSLLFVPAGVGMMVHFDRIAAEWLPILAGQVVSTLIAMVVTAGVMQGAHRLFRARERTDA